MPTLMKQLKDLSDAFSIKYLQQEDLCQTSCEMHYIEVHCALYSLTLGIRLSVDTENKENRF